MTQDEIIWQNEVLEMAKQAGGMFSELPLMDAWVFDGKSLEAFAKLVEERTAAKAVEREREACAKVCEELAELNRFSETDSMWEWGECAAAIRARGKA